MERCYDGGSCTGNGLQGMISVVGTGPGGPEHITPAVAACIRAADIVIGYSTYLDLLNDLLVDKESHLLVDDAGGRPLSSGLRSCRGRPAGGHGLGETPASTPWPVSSSRSPWSVNSDLDIEVIPGDRRHEQLRRPARSAAHARFRGGQPVRPPHPLEDHRASPARRRLGRFCHRHLQP